MPAAPPTAVKPDPSSLVALLEKDLVWTKDPLGQQQAILFGDPNKAAPYGVAIKWAPGQFSHWNGYKIDISRTSCATSYIKRNFSSIGGGKWRSSAGNIYFDEGDHWDITYF